MWGAFKEYFDIIGHHLKLLALSKLGRIELPSKLPDKVICKLITASNFGGLHSYRAEIVSPKITLGRPLKIWLFESGGFLDIKGFCSSAFEKNESGKENETTEYIPTYISKDSAEGFFLESTVSLYLDNKEIEEIYRLSRNFDEFALNLYGKNNELPTELFMEINLEESHSDTLETRMQNVSQYRLLSSYETPINIQSSRYN